MPTTAPSYSAKDVSTEEAAALQKKYLSERDKRLRDDGPDQYVEINHQHTFGHLLDDPYAQNPIEREPLTDTVDAIVVGGGFGGLLGAIRMRQNGLQTVRVVEKGGDFGGTWYWNRYPGAACDIEAYIYLPLLEETGYMPTERYAKASEIYDYTRQLATHYDLYRDACLQTEVTGAWWDEEAGQWVVNTDRGDEMRAQFLLVCNGPLHRPKLPLIPGVTEFQGHSFHTSRWDYEYTGGNRDGNLHKLADKRVGIIGTGATSVQAVPHLAESAKQLHVFQRTPSSVDYRQDGPTDPDWVKTLKPGWHQHRMDNFNNLVSGGYEAEDLVNDGWTDIIRNLLLAASEDGQELTHDQLIELSKRADFAKMNQVRARIDKEVQDPETAEALKPWYRQFCKRPCFHDSYLEAFNRPSVTLVDTNGKGVERITRDGVVVAGKEYPVDCLIYATGFTVGSGLNSSTVYPLYGAGKVKLQDLWGEEGARSYHGIMVRNFPNLFIIGGPQGGFTANFPHNLNEQACHVGYIVGRAKSGNTKVLHPSKEAQDAWVEEVIDKARLREDFFKECTPGYYNNEGKLNKSARQHGAYGGGSIAYFDLLKQWRDAGDMPGLEVS